MMPQNSTVGPDIVCGCRLDGGLLTLACAGGGTITAVDFASIGTPVGTCGAFSPGTCAGDPAKAAAYVTAQCVGHSSCSLAANQG